MQPVRLRILGDFWDSHIYRGRLYLWDMSNVVHVFDWSRFVGSLSEAYGQPFLDIVFAHGDELYRDFMLGSIARDEDVRGLVKQKIEGLAKLDFQFNLADLEPYRLGSQDSPFRDLHDDMTIFKNTAYALTEEGFFSSEVHQPKRRKLLLKRAQKVWCGTGVNISASRYGLAIAAASDGLFEYGSWDDEPRQVSGMHASLANWLFASIYASSAVGHGYLAGYRWVKDLEDNHFRREFGGIMGEAAVFHDSSDAMHSSFTWGSQEKIYKVVSEKIRVIRFVQKYLWEPSYGRGPFEEIGEIPVRGGASELPISAGVSFLGSVIEYSDEIVVLESDFSLHRVNGAATRWRVFPRSRWYPNHLHVVLQNHLEILSVNGDLFADQVDKLSGINFEKKMLGEI